MHNTADLGVRGINHSSHLCHISLESPFWTVPGESPTPVSPAALTLAGRVCGTDGSHSILVDQDGLQWMSVKQGDEYTAPLQPLHQRHAE